MAVSKWNEEMWLIRRKDTLIQVQWIRSVRGQSAEKHVWPKPKCVHPFFFQEPSLSAVCQSGADKEPQETSFGWQALRGWYWQADDKDVMCAFTLCSGQNYSLQFCLLVSQMTWNNSYGCGSPMILCGCGSAISIITLDKECSSWTSIQLFRHFAELSQFCKCEKLL